MGVDKMRRQKRWKKEMEGHHRQRVAVSDYPTLMRVVEIKKERKKKEGMSFLPLRCLLEFASFKSKIDKKKEKER